MWYTLLLILCISLALTLLIYVTESNYLILKTFNTALSIFLAFTFNELMHFELKYKKYHLISILRAQNIQEAKLKFLKYYNNQISSIDKTAPKSASTDNSLST